MGAVRFLAWGIAACIALTGSFVEADELVLPYSCIMDAGSPRLSPSDATTYPIIGRHEDMPFTACSSSAAWTCETMMVHKFTIECSGQRVSWAKVAASAKTLGVALPDKLPAGFAPVSRLRGRFILPAFGATTPIARVTTDTLSSDAVIEPPAEPRQAEPAAASAPWVTIVDPATAATSKSPSTEPSSGSAMKIAGVVSILLVSLMGACLLLVRRRQIGPLQFSVDANGSPPLTARARDVAVAFLIALRQRFEAWRATASNTSAGYDDDASNLLLPVHTRIHETEYLVSMLPPDLLLRHVLTSELDALHDRVADLGRRAGDLSVDRLRSAVRAVLRDLDRIARIVEGAMPAPATGEARASAPEPDIPTTAFEAYRVLGLNPNAPDAAVKKIVDALRMSWHPDHAHDEADRRYREQRIKQINAAWDLLKVRPAAAA
ncbi:DnaJ domain-containing protein [Hyphomicrobium sp.]|uniref:DnaJ domain-containing protein n=1 Tax=Hyphomicrobium sp. TaxID=82 RepID=UPI000FA3EA98|nr:DnaJ domain-containing protein [Hyphomicrobium sp.]RUO98315.1 MAG: molecular chaperone DnaJ [Hyphomicrobium sp.]